MSFATPFAVSLATFSDWFSSRSPLFTIVRVTESMITRKGIEAVTSSSCVVLGTFSQGRGSSPGFAGFSEEKRYWTVVSRPICLRISVTPPSATALMKESAAVPVTFARPLVSPLLHPVNSSALNLTEALLRIFAGLASPVPVIKYSR